MKIEQLPSGSYRIRKTYDKVTYTITVPYKPTQREALKLMSEEIDKIQVAKTRMTFKNAAQKYVNDKNHVLSASTIREYTRMITAYSKSFQEKRVTEITQKDVQAEINNFAKKLAPKTVRNYHGFISAVLSYFVPSLVLNTTLPQKIKKSPYIPCDNDVKKILEYSRDTMYEVPLLLACFGLRRSEICALTMDDIEGNIVHINKGLVLDKDKKWVLKTTKSVEGSRDIWIPDEVVDRIHHHGKIYDGYPGSITDYLKEAEAKLGLKDFSIHKLRHYYASMSHALGIPDSYIMSSGGWKSDYVLKNVYRHAMDEKKVEMQQFAGEYLKEVMF